MLHIGYIIHMADGPRSSRIGLVADRREASFGAWSDVDLSARLDALRRGARRRPAARRCLPAARPTPSDPELALDARRRASARPAAATSTPPSYGAEAHPANEPGDPLRDRVELALAAAALERDLPAARRLPRACSCSTSRSAAASSSTSPTPTGSTAASPDAFIGHAVEVVAGTRLALDPRRRRGRRCAPTTTRASRRSRGRSTPPAHSPDGLVEAAEVDRTDEFCLAVLWHPEEDLEGGGLSRARRRSSTQVGLSERAVADGEPPRARGGDRVTARRSPRRADWRSGRREDRRHPPQLPLALRRVRDGGAAGVPVVLPQAAEHGLAPRRRGRAPARLSLPQLRGRDRARDRQARQRRLARPTRSTTSPATRSPTTSASTTSATSTAARCCGSRARTASARSARQMVDAADVDPADLTVRTFVNGEQVQEGTPATDLLFSFAYQVADVSRLITLEPGDVLLTGTPANSRPVEPGDVVEVEVEGIGRARATRSSSPIATSRRRRAARGQRPDPARRARDARGRGRAPGGRRSGPVILAGPPRDAARRRRRRGARALGAALLPDADRAARAIALCCAAPTRTSASSCGPADEPGVEHVAYELRSGVSLADAAERIEAGAQAEEVEVPVRGQGVAPRRPRRQRDRPRRAGHRRRSGSRRWPATPTSCRAFTRASSSTSTT